jgi:hypothetical protein
VSVDLNDDPQVLESYWGNIREKLYEIIVSGGMRKGEFNYDAEVGHYQLKNTKLKNCRVSDVEFINCEMEGIFDRSWFFGCKIKNSRLTDCHLVKENIIDFSKVAESELHISNVLNDCYIENKKQIINCEVNAGVIRNGEIGKLAKISKDTLIVEGQPAEAGNAGSSSFSDSEQDARNKKKIEKKK